MDKSASGGRVSMNTVMVDVTDIPEAKAGDEVVLFGRQGDAEVKTSDLTSLTGHILTEAYIRGVTLIHKWLSPFNLNNK